MRLPVVLLTLAIATAAVAETRRISFWPDAVPAAIQKHVDGGYALDALRALGKFHRVQGSPGFKAAADWVAGELGAAGVEEFGRFHVCTPATGSSLLHSW